MNQNPTTTSPETENKASANQTDLDKLIVSIEDTEKQKKTDTNINDDKTAVKDSTQDALDISGTEESMIVSFPAFSKDEENDAASIVYHAGSAYAEM